MRLYGRKRKLWTIFGDFLLFRVVQSGWELNFYSISLKKWVGWVKGSTLSRKKKFSRRFQDITKVCRHLFRIISIRRKNREGHTTFWWDSTVGNVSYWRFLVNFCCSEWFKVVEKSIFIEFPWKNELSESRVRLWVTRKNFLGSFRT